MSKDTSKLRSVIRSILSEGRHKKNPDGSFTFQFDVYGSDDETYKITATYDPRRPFEVEVWNAHDASGRELNVDELQAGIGVDLEEKAFDWVSQNLDASS